MFLAHCSAKVGKGGLAAFVVASSKEISDDVYQEG